MSAARRRAGSRVLCAGLLLFSSVAVRADTVALRGRVVDGAGAAVAGARVELQRIAPRYESGSRIAAGVLRPESAGRVRTSGDGGYELEVPEMGMWQVEVSAPGKIPLRHRLIPLIEDRELPPAVLEADGGAWIAVVDAGGAAIPGAQVWMRPSEASGRRTRGRPGDWRERGRYALTDDAGNAYLSRRRGQQIRVWAYAGGFLPSRSVAIEGDRAKITLDRGRPVDMRFLTANGEPAAQALLGVGGLQWVSAKTDHDGRARLFLLPDQPLAIMLHLPTGQRESATVEAEEEDFELEPGQPEEMTLPRPVVIAGRVIDATTREPAADAWVWSAGDPGRIERADRAGGYRLVEAASAYWQIGAAAPGYQPKSEQLRAEAGGQRERTLVLAPAAAISGRVVDAEGEAVAGAEVEVWRAGRNTFGVEREFQATSGGGGRFRVSGLAREADYELRVRAAGFVPALVAAKASSGADLEVVLLAGSGVSGRVVSEDGAPIAGARVVVTAGPASWMTLISQARPSEPPAADSGADGVFRLEGLSPEQSVLAVSKEGFAPHQVSLFDPSAGAPEDAVPKMIELGDVVLDRGAELRGIVRNEDEEPIAGVQIYLTGASSRAPTLHAARYARTPPVPRSTDEEGRFAIPGLVAGETLSLMFDHDEYLRHSADGLEVGQGDPLEVVLERAARISGRVENESRQPVAGIMVEALPLGGSRRGLTGAFGDATRRDSAPTDGEGRFVLERVPPGAVELLAAGDGYVASDTVELSVERGERREGVVLRVRRGVSLEGTVRDTARRPVAGAILQVSEILRLRRSMHGGATAQSDADGVYRLEGLAPDADEIILNVHHPDYLEAEHVLELGGGTQRFDVVLERGTLVSGTVLGPGGEPMPGAAVGLDGGGGVLFAGRETTLSSADGGFEISGVAPGVYRLFAMKEGFARSTSPEPVTVAGAPVEGLRLYLTRGGTIRGRVLGLEPEDLVGVRVFASDGQSRGATGAVGEDGEYRVTHVGFGEGMVSAMSQATGQHVSESFTLDTAGGEAWVDLEFRPAEGSTLSGAVRLDGEPWRGIQVMAQGGVGSQGAAGTDQDGRFEISGLRDGRHQVILLGGVAVAHTEIVEVLGATEVTIEITTVPVRGRVVAAGTGEPVARAEVTAEGGEPIWLRSLAATTETAGSGAFEIVLPANREITLRAKAAGWSEASLAVMTGPGPPIEGVELVVGAASEIEMEVRLASGLTPASVFAAVLDPLGRRVAGEMFPDTRQMPLRIGSVPAGDWTLIVAGEGGALVRVPVTVPGPPLTVILPPESRITVDLGTLAQQMGNAQMRILGRDGKPRVLPSYGQLLEAWPVLGAHTTVPYVPPGEWVVEITGDQGQVWRRSVTTVGGETVSVGFD